MGEKSLGSFNVICPSLSSKGIRIRKEKRKKKKKDSEKKRITKQKKERK